jgi:hypothetical protein
MRCMRPKLMRRMATIFVDTFTNCTDYLDFYKATHRWHSNRYALWKRFGLPKPLTPEIIMACDIAAFVKGGMSRTELQAQSQSSHTKPRDLISGLGRNLVTDDPLPPIESPVLDDLLPAEDDTLIL